MNTIDLLREALMRDNRGDVAGASTQYRKVLDREPDNIDAMFLLGRAYCQQAQFEHASKILQKVTALEPGHAPAHNLLGMVLQRLGQPEDALGSFGRALQIEPNDVMATISKADTLAELGRYKEAVVEFDRALALDKTNVVAWCNRGLAQEALGRDAEAVESFGRALVLAPDLPEIHFNLANVLHRLQQHENAVLHYRRAIFLNPNLTRAHANLASALFSLKRWSGVIKSVDEAIKLEPRSAPLYDVKGMALWHLEHYEDSLTSFNQALAIDPNSAVSLNNKGRLLYVLGRLEESRGVLERAATIDPNNTRNYLDIGALKNFAPEDAFLKAMEELLSGIELRSEEDQINLHFALAKAYRDIGNYKNSFHHLVQGNALKRRQLDYNEDAAIAAMFKICTAFTPDIIREKEAQGDTSNLPIFIIGMPRSGTTLIEQILASHPHVYGAGERKDFRDAFRSIKGPEPISYPEIVSELTSEQLREIGVAYLARISASSGRAERITDKLPHNFLYAGLIHLALPNARIIHARRNPVDTCLSCFSTLFTDGLPFTYDLGELGRYYRAYEHLMQHWHRVLPSGVLLDVQYEEMVQDVEAQARRILAHCGLEWDSACLDFHSLERPITTASAGQVRQPIYQTSVERWRPYEKLLRPLLEALDQPA